jgi:hypothetical protein
VLYGLEVCDNILIEGAAGREAMLDVGLEAGPSAVDISWRLCTGVDGALVMLSLFGSKRPSISITASPNDSYPYAISL